MAKGWGRNQQLQKEGKRFCSRCKCILLLSDFHPNKAHADGMSSWCKNCAKPLVKDKSWSSKLMHHYGMTPKQYYEMLGAQNNCCAICEIPVDENNKRLAVDHSHASNRVRGLLCFHCNTALGHMFDKIKTAENALSYLKKNYEIDKDWDTDLLVEKLKACGV